MQDFGGKRSRISGQGQQAGAAGPAVGKQTLTEQLPLLKPIGPQPTVSQGYASEASTRTDTASADGDENAMFSTEHITPGQQQKVLLLGEGDFSFAASLAKNLPAKGAGVVATSYDSAEDVNNRYSNASVNITDTREGGATVVHGVDAQTIDPLLGGPPPEFQYIVFNFPFVPGPRAAAKQRNKTMLANFLLSASKALATNGKIYITSKPYWLARFDLTESAQASNLNCDASLSFDPSEFPGYEHRKSHEDASADSTNVATTCVFSKAA